MVGSAENPKPWNPEERVEDKWDESDHGKVSTYNAGCRCKKCVAANTEKQRAYRASPAGQETRLRRKATTAATNRLRQAHPREYTRLFHEELDALRERGVG